MVSLHTNNVPLLIKIPNFPKMANKLHCEGSKATDNDNSGFYKYTEHTKDKETSSNI